VVRLHHARKGEIAALEVADPEGRGGVRLGRDEGADVRELGRHVGAEDLGGAGAALGVEVLVWASAGVVRDMSEWEVTYFERRGARLIFP
jgi:hypothetical protein